MKLEKILAEVFITVQKCNIHSYPIDCFEILRQYGFDIVRYSDLSEKKMSACFDLSEDACVIGTTIYYNDLQPHARIRFSVMHELGHHVLSSPAETDANHFASYILAPRMAIHYAGCQNHVEVAKKFDISYEAADYAFNDYRRWHRTAVYRMSILDKQFYQHFYDPDQKKFIWNIGECIYCHRPIYNDSQRHVCSLCSTRHYIAGLGYFEVPDNLQWYNRL